MLKHKTFHLHFFSTINVKLQKLTKMLQSIKDLPSFQILWHQTIIRIVVKYRQKVPLKTSVFVRNVS